jgi:hypothetical protein
METRELTAGEKPHDVTIELVGVPKRVVAAFQQNASDDPEAVESAKRALHERDGETYAWDSKTKFFTRLPAPVAAATVRRSPVASPGEQGRRGRSSSASTRGSPDDPGELPQRLSADERRELKKRIDARRRELVAAPEQADTVERSLERHWREDAA